MRNTKLLKKAISSATRFTPWGRPSQADEPSALPKGLHDIVASVWERYNDEEYRRDQSHWRGHGRWKDVERWLSIGRSTLDGLREIERMTGQTTLASNPVVLEWGPGGGSNLFALKDIAKTIYAIDVSSKNLDESKRVLAEAGFFDFRPILLKDSIEGALAEVNEPIDIFISTAVFQHFPSKGYGLQVLRATGARLSPSGIGRLQIRFDNGNARYAPKPLHEYKKSHITATSYRVDEFWDALRAAKLDPLAIKNVNSSKNYATFLLSW